MSKEMPASYAGREQTFLKHRALEEYLIRWALKLGSIGRRWSGSPLKLWYCDVFSGPWKAHDNELQDTSIHLGLTSMVKAQERARQYGSPFEIGAVFVERDPRAFRALEDLCGRFADRVDVHPLLGRFQDRTDDVNRLVGDDPAFVFVDPIGWTDVGMTHVAAISRVRRDILVRVPSEIARFQGKGSVRRGILDFLGASDDDLLDTSEQALIDLYRRRLKSECRVPYAADMAIPEAKRDRTSCWLVVGGHHPQVLTVFRDVEKRIVGGEALDVREEIREERRSPGQLSLLAPSDIKQFDQMYADQLRDCVRRLPAEIRLQLARSSPLMYGDLWPAVLEEHHISEPDLADIVREMAADNSILIDGLKPGERRIKDQHVLYERHSVLSVNGGPSAALKSG